MSAWVIHFGTHNNWQSGVAAVDGTPDLGFPASRLWDRSLDFFWKETTGVGVDRTIHLDQSGDIQETRYLVLGRHNFQGRTIHWEYSDNDVDWTPAVVPFVISADDEVTTIALGPEGGITARYWRVRVIGVIDPRCGEIYSGPVHSFMPQREGAPTGVHLANVVWRGTAGGLERGVQWGAKKRTFSYVLWLPNSVLELPNDTLLDEFFQVIDDVENYSLPFVFESHRHGELMMARFSAAPDFDFNHNTRTLIGFTVQEML